MKASLCTGLLGSLTTLAAACSSGSDSVDFDGSGGLAASTAGTGSSGLAANGGSQATGATAGTAASRGAITNAGGQAAGGTAVGGGTAAAGFATSGVGGDVSVSGGAPSGGGTNTGGTSATAGSVATGGDDATGGNVAAGMGGDATTGGDAATGADTAGGGAAAMGGASPAGGNANTGGSSNSSPTFHVFLLLGQSNMAGNARAEDGDKVEDSRITVLGFDNCAATGRVADEWDVAVPPLHECPTGAVSPGDWFSKTLIEVLPEGDTIGLVPCALSGAPIQRMMKGQSDYDWIIRRGKAAQEAGGVIEGMLFHQGESNCGQSDWPNQVSTFVEDLRTDLDLGDAPFLAGELPYNGGCSTHNPLVNELPGLITNTYVVSAEGLPVNPNDSFNLHFGHDETVELGKRYAETMIEALGL